jgi:hypothetical protein
VYFSVNLIATCVAIRNLFIFKQKRLASKSKVRVGMAIYLKYNNHLVL